MSLNLNSTQMPSSDAVFQKMLDAFPTAGELAIYIISGAVSLGILTVLGAYVWKLFKSWLLDGYDDGEGEFDDFDQYDEDYMDELFEEYMYENDSMLDENADQYGDDLFDQMTFESDSMLGENAEQYDEDYLEELMERMREERLG